MVPVLKAKMPRNLRVAIGMSPTRRGGAGDHTKRQTYQLPPSCTRGFTVAAPSTKGVGIEKGDDAQEICPLLSSAEPKSTRAVADGYIVSGPRCDTYFTLYCSRARARFPSRAPARSLPRAPSQAAGSVESATTLSVETLKRVARTRPR